MINSYLKKQLGAATFLITTLLLVSITLIVIFAANYTIMQQKMISNTHRSQQAYLASEAGLEFGINYLKQNSTSILTHVTSGFLVPFTDANITNITLTNNSKFTVSYTNPTANNLNVITVTSVGTNDDSTSTRTTSELVKFGSLLYTSPTTSLTAKGAVSLSGSPEIINTTANQTILSGSSVSFSGSAKTTLSSGTGSTAGHIGSDVTGNNSAIGSQSTSNFFQKYFGLNQSTVKNSMTYTFTNLGNYSSSLSGKQGTSIWIEEASGTAVINGSVTIGSAASPVLIIVNGNLRLSGSPTIYGFIYVIGGETTDFDVTGSAKVYGALVTSGDMDLKGSTKITYDPTVLTNLQNQVGNYYAKVPGSWRDF